MNIPRLSASDIEKKARTVIEYFDPSVLESPVATPLRDFTLRCVKDFGLEFDDSKSLGVTSCGSEILGAFQLRPRGIFLDKSLNDSPRQAFVLAHEFGHFVLHRSLILQKEDYSDYELSDTERDLVTGKKILTNPREWIEWQANRFASAFLMPVDTIHKALRDVQIEIGVKRNVGMVYIENKRYSLLDFNRTTMSLAEIYGTTPKTIEYRLKDLGLVIDTRDDGTSHISQLLCAD